MRNQERAEAFYSGLLKLPIAARMPAFQMTFFTLGNHHDFAIKAVGDDAPDAPENSPGLYHVAFKIGNLIDELREAKLYLEAADIKVRAADHIVSKSIYCQDPDGNTVELYIDTSDVWRQRPEAVAQVAPLDL